MDKNAALDAVLQAAEDYRNAQVETLAARERFVDSIIDAKSARATQQEIAERCVIEPNNASKVLSRQRVAQFLSERKPKSEDS